MIIGQVNRQVAYGGLFKNLFKKRKDTQILDAVCDQVSAKGSLNWAKESGDPKKIAEASERLKKATQTLINTAGKENIKMINKFL